MARAVTENCNRDFWKEVYKRRNKTTSGVSRISFRGEGVPKILERGGVFAWQSHAFARGGSGG